MMRHKMQELNPHQKELFNKARLSLNDGINTIKYEVFKKTLFTGFTYFLFDIDSFKS